jgi:hypothetical protein
VVVWVVEGAESNHWAWRNWVSWLHVPFNNPEIHKWSVEAKSEEDKRESLRKPGSVIAEEAKK